MASNLVDFPGSGTKDYEFIGFKFNGRHSSEFGLTVVSSSGMAQESLFADFEDKIVEVSGKDGAYYFGTKVKTRPLSLSLAFDSLTSANKKAVQVWLNPRTVSTLIFDEAPYKYYYVKVASPPSFSYIPFETDIVDGKQHIYKGTLELSFICTDPYGYSDYALVSDVPIWNGTVWTTYSDYPTNSVKFYDATHIPGWYGASGLHLTAPSPDLAYANDSDGYIVGSITAGAIVPNFYNAGEIDSPIGFTVTVPNFNIGTTWQFKNTTPDPDDIFELQSLKNIPALSADAGTWKITYDPTKVLVTGKTSTDSYTATYNLGALHNGTFLKAYPGSNFLYTSHNLTNVTIQYKYKYW